MRYVWIMAVLVPTVAFAQLITPPAQPKPKPGQQQEFTGLEKQTFLKQMAERFDQMDLNRDGVLSKQEMQVETQAVADKTAAIPAPGAIAPAPMPAPIAQPAAPGQPVGIPPVNSDQIGKR